MVYNQLSRQSQPTIYINIYLSVTTQNPFMRFVKLSLPSGHLRNNFSHILFSFCWYVFSSKILMRVRLQLEWYITSLKIVFWSLLDISRYRIYIEIKQYPLYLKNFHVKHFSNSFIHKICGKRMRIQKRWKKFLFFSQSVGKARRVYLEQKFLCVLINQKLLKSYGLLKTENLLYCRKKLFMH